MTIAACYLSAEGVVLGADSTATMFVAGRGGQIGSQHHYNFAQKVFEFGAPGSTVGVALWGVGSLGDTSYRTLIAEIADEAAKRQPPSLADVARMATKMLWERYETAFAPCLTGARELHAKGGQASEKEVEERLYWEQTLSGGFCLGGRWGETRRPEAFEVQFGPFASEPPTPQPLELGNAKFWGCPNLIDRLILGVDNGLWSRILGSGKWGGTPKDLYGLVDQGALGQPYDLPLREAIDWIYASIYTTIKAMKFSHLAPMCGGPIEIAVISSDRPFRWVRHKTLGEAVAAHQTREDRP